jgi:hypothetical protein
MKKIVLCVLFLLSGCGSLKVTPKNCKTNAEWSAGPATKREMTHEEQQDEKVIDLRAKDEFYVFSDREIRLRDILEEHGIKCEEVKKLRVEIKTSWFIKREVLLKVVKN